MTSISFDYQPIDEALREQAESIDDTLEDNRSYDGWLMRRGVQGVAHVHLMRTALAYVEQSLLPEQFVSDYGIQFGFDIEHYGWDSGLTVRFSRIAQDGIYFPSHSRFALTDEDHFFCADQGNAIRDKDLWRKLKDKVWVPSDFSETDVLKDGLRFGLEMWNFAREHYEDNRTSSDGIPALSPRLREVGDKLVEYYQRVVDFPVGESGEQ